MPRNAGAKIPAPEHPFLIASLMRDDDQNTILLLCSDNPCDGDADSFLARLAAGVPHLIHRCGSQFEPQAFDKDDAAGLFPEGFHPTGLLFSTPANSWRRRAADLVDALAASGVRLEFYVPGKPEARRPPTGPLPLGRIVVPDAAIHAGSFESNGSIWAGDPCYDNPASWMRIESAPGTWETRVVLRDDSEAFGNGMMPARIEAWLSGTEPPSPADSAAEGAADVDSARLCLRTRRPPAPDDYGSLDRNDAGGSFGSPSFSGRPDGIVSLTFFGDGSYPVFVRRDANGKASAITMVTDPFDPLFHPEKQEEARSRESERASSTATEPDPSSDTIRRTPFAEKASEKGICKKRFGRR